MAELVRCCWCSNSFDDFFRCSTRHFHTEFDDYQTLFEIFIGLIFLSFPITLFLVAIPSRVAMNLLIKDLRYPKWKETLILVLTFIALGWMFYAFAVTSGERG
jgi:hypothetical protein